VITTIGAFFFAYFLRFDRFPEANSHELVILVGSVLIVLFLSGTYSGKQLITLPQFPVTTFFKTLFSIIPCALVVYILGPNDFTQFFGRGVLPIGILFAGVGATLNRYFVNHFYYYQTKSRNILFIGGDNYAADFRENILNFEALSNVEYSESLESANKLKFGEIVLAPDYHPSDNETKTLVDYRLAGLPVRTFADFWEYYWNKVPIESVKDDWFYFSQGFSVVSNGISQRFKRAIDVVLSALMLILSFPIVSFCSLLVVMTSKGPAFFKQIRVGENGKTFVIYKLRTMVENAESGGAQWAAKNDARITPLGRFLRSSRLDELPQLWNVLKGDMSMVGPRPERPEFTGSLSKNIPYYDLRNLVKPGLTGWAQVKYPYGASEEDALRKLEYDLYYIKHQSIFFDFNILIRTVLTVLERKGS